MSATHPSRSATLQRAFKSFVLRGFVLIIGFHPWAFIFYNRFARGPFGRGQGDKDYSKISQSRIILPEIRVSSPKSPLSSEAVVKYLLSNGFGLQQTFRATAPRISVTPCEASHQSQFSDRGFAFGSHEGTKARSLHDAARRLARHTFAPTFAFQATMDKKAARYELPLSNFTFHPSNFEYGRSI